MMAENKQVHASPPPYNPNQAGISQHTYPPPNPIPIPQAQVVYPQIPSNPHSQQGYVPVAINPPPGGVAVAPQVGPYPARVTCPICHNQTITRTESVSSSKTHTIALILCILGCWPCCLIPYCMDDCMNINHYCASCNSYVGKYES